MTGDDLPDDDHVVRYVKPSVIDDESIDGSAFLLRDEENSLSVNWLEVFGSGDQSTQLDEVRRVSRLRLSTNGRFVRLKVGETKRSVSATAEEAGISVALNMSETPLTRTDEFEADPSHAEITGVPSGESDEAMLVGDMIANCVSYPLYPGKTG